MRIAVVGGSGTLGSRVVAELAGRGDEVRVLTRSAPAALPAGAAHHPVDLLSGDGLAAALDGVEAVVDAANSAAGSKRKGEALLLGGGRRLLAAEREAGVGHHLAISIVGCDRVPLGYYDVKVRQEADVAAGPVPWTLLRATQFHQLVAAAFETADRFRILPSAAALLQPIDPLAVAQRLAAAAHEAPAGRLPDLVGPQILSLGELAAAWAGARPRARLRLPLPLPGRLGRALREGGLCDPDADAAGISFERWLAER